MSCGHDGCTCGPDHGSEQAHAHGHGHQLPTHHEAADHDDCCGAHDADNNDHHSRSLKPEH